MISKCFFLLSISSYKFSELIDEEIGRKEIFNRGREFNDNREIEESKFYQRKIKIGPHENILAPTQEEIFEAFLSLTLIKKYNHTTNSQGLEIWHLMCPKIDACAEVGRELETSWQYIYRHFPSNIKCNQSKYHECEDCITRRSHSGP